MQAAFFTQGKKRNSTSHPNGIVGGTLYEIVLKNPTSLLTPTLVMRFPTSNSAPNYNYCYIPALDERYYFINEWRCVGVNWECDLSVDVLATYDSNILASTQTVLRSTVLPNMDMSNTAVIAGLPETETQIISTNFTTDVSQGTFILALANDDNNSFGAASLYAMTYEWCGAFMQKLLGEIDWTGSITDISTDLLECLFNPMDYVLSCRYYPMGMSFFTGDSPVAYTSIRLGHWLIDGVNNVPLTTTDVVKSALLTNFNISGHPAAESYGPWLNYDPYYAAEAFIPPFGSFAIPAWALGQSIYCNLTVDALTGQAFIQPYIADTFLEPHTAQLGIDVPVAQLGPDIIGGTIKSVASLDLTANNQIANLKTNTDLAVSDVSQAPSILNNGIVSNIAGLLNQAMLGTITSGGIKVQSDKANAAAGSLCAIHRDAYITRKYLPIDGNIINKAGYPCFKTDILQAFKNAGVDSVYTPWVQCADPHVVIDTASDREVAAIEQYLQAGVYLE